MEQLFELLTPLIQIYGGKLGFLPAVIMIVGTLRLFVKPVMASIETYVNLSPSKSDDEWFAKAKESSIYKMLVFVLDWFASIKLPK